MNIENNLNAMISSELQMNQLASNIANVGNTIAEPEFQGVSQDIIDSIVGQIPEIISYSANAKSIETQNATSDMLLNIRA